MFIALPGLTLALDEVDQFEDVMKTAEKAIRNFINEEPVGYKIYEMEHPDVLLWYGGYGLSQPGTGSCIIKICFGARAFGVSKDTGSVL